MTSLTKIYNAEDEAFDAEVFGIRKVIKFKGFGRPYDIEAGPIHWFECEGLPLESWEKPCQWYSGDDPVTPAPSKSLFFSKLDKDCRVFG